MAVLTDEQKRKVRLYLTVQQVENVGSFVGSVPVVTETTHRLETALENLTDSGVGCVTELLAKMDPLWEKLAGVDDSLQVSQLGTVMLRADEFQARTRQWGWYQSQLDAVLFPRGDGVLEEHGGPSWEP
jgi:hypothetical protein